LPSDGGGRGGVKYLPGTLVLPDASALARPFPLSQTAFRIEPTEDVSDGGGTRRRPLPGVLQLFKCATCQNPTGSLLASTRQNGLQPSGTPGGVEHQAEPDGTAGAAAEATALHACARIPTKYPSFGPPKGHARGGPLCAPYWAVMSPLGAELRQVGNLCNAWVTERPGASAGRTQFATGPSRVPAASRAAGPRRSKKKRGGGGKA